MCEAWDTSSVVAPLRLCDRAHRSTTRHSVISIPWCLKDCHTSMLYCRRRLPLAPRCGGSCICAQVRIVITICSVARRFAPQARVQRRGVGLASAGCERRRCGSVSCLARCLLIVRPNPIRRSILRPSSPNRSNTARDEQRTGGGACVPSCLRQPTNHDTV